MIPVLAVVAAMVFVAVYADATLPHECRTCGRPYDGRRALARHRRIAHRD